MARRKSSKGRVLVSPKGRKYTKNIKAFEDSIRNDSKLTDSEKRAKIADLHAYIEDRAKQNRGSSGNRLTTNGFEAFEKDTGLERMFASVGMSAQELADEYGLDEEELLDPDNWEGAIFKGQYEFHHTYTGVIMEQL